MLPLDCKEVLEKVSQKYIFFSSLFYVLWTIRENRFFLNYDKLSQFS